MATKFKIDDDVRDVLRQAIIGPTDLKLTGQLDRKLYERVNKVLAAAGGKWNRSAGAHIFPSDPRKILGIAIDTGIATNVQQETQLFPTPPALAAAMIEESQIKPGMRILEPSAGTGNLYRAIVADAGNSPDLLWIVCIEILPALCVQLRALRGAGSLSHLVKEADFMQCRNELGKFDRILMNPPFANADDIKHIKHAVTFLKPGGRLVAICANGPRQEAALRPLASYWEPLPAGTFSESGTDVSTVLLVINA